MSAWLLSVQTAYALHRAVVLASATGALVVLGQIALALWIARRIREIGHLRERLSRLADGLALLTDTTEAGLGAIVRELQQLKRPTAPVKGTTRSGVAKRVAAATRKGADVMSIARDEALSESEVRLQMALTQAATERSHTGV